MRRVLANAVLSAGLILLLCSNGQARGGARASAPRSSGFQGGYGLASHTHLPPRPTRPVTSSTKYSNPSPGISFPPVTGSSLINPGEASCILNPSYSSSYYCRQYYPQGAAFGFEPIYPFWLPGGDNGTEQPATSAPESEPDALTAQVGNLAAEIDMMRQEQAARDFRGGPSAAPLAMAEEKPPTTLLVYRDGHQMEVQDYAIMGNTLWVFTGQATNRVPLADLDLAATERMNSQRGVDFTPLASH